MNGFMFHSLHLRPIILPIFFFLLHFCFHEMAADDERCGLLPDPTSSVQ